MALPKEKEIVFPLTMESYKTKCFNKITNALNEISKYNSIENVQLEIIETDYSLECDKKYNQGERHHRHRSIAEDVVFHRITNTEAQWLESKIEEYKYAIKLRYQLKMTWRTYPQNYTDYFSLIVRDALYKAGLKYMEGEIYWQKDVDIAQGGGQILTQTFGIFCDKSLKENEAIELYEEYHKLNP